MQMRGRPPPRVCNMAVDKPMVYEYTPWSRGGARRERLNRKGNDKMTASSNVMGGTSYLDLRERMQARDRGLREKVMSLTDAISLVNDGDHMAIGGNTFSRTPFAAVWEVVRQKKKNLTVSRNITSSEGDMLLAGGCTEHYITSWFSQGIVWGVSKVMRHFMESGAVRYDEWSHMSIGMMYRAGALGLPFMPTRVMMGSDMARLVADDIKEMDCPTPAKSWPCCRRSTRMWRSSTSIAPTLTATPSTTACRSWRPTWPWPPTR